MGGRKAIAMDKRRIRKHRAHKRAMAVCRGHRDYLTATPGGALTFARFEHLVGNEAAQFRAQESSRLNRYAATERCRRARQTLHAGVRHVSTVANLSALGLPCDTSRVTNDVQRLARAEAVLAAVAPHAERLESGGVQPGLLDALARELAAFRAAKSAIARAGVQFTEATDALDQTLADTDLAIAVLEGILITSPDAPVGALTALRQAKRIGPRVSSRDHAAQSAPESRRDQEPRLEFDGRRRRWLPLLFIPRVARAPARPAAARAAEDGPRYALAKSG